MCLEEEELHVYSVGITSGLSVCSRGGILPLAAAAAALEVTKPRGCSLLPTPGGARPSSVPLELLMERRKEGRGFVPAVAWLAGGDTPVVTPTDRGGCPPSLCGVAVSSPTITADSL